MTYEDLIHIARFLRRYATAVETKLYIDMKTEHAFKEIEEANRLAELVEDKAMRMDTISPVDLG